MASPLEMSLADRLRNFSARRSGSAVPTQPLNRTSAPPVALATAASLAVTGSADPSPMVPVVRKPRAATGVGFSRYGTPGAVAFAQPLDVHLPDPAAHAHMLLRVVVEVCEGRRPISQLQRYATADVVRLASRRAALAQRLRAKRSAVAKPSLVQSVWVNEPVPGVAEIAATVRTHTMVRAAAMRLEARHNRWHITSYSIA